MSKKIENKDLVQGNPFQPTQDQAVDFKKVIDNLNTSLNQTSDEFKEMLRQGQKLSSSRPLSGYDNIKQVEQGIRRVEQASEELTKNERDRVKLRERLNNLTSEGAEENARLREEIRRQNQELRNNARAVLDSSNEYKKLEKEVREAQQEFKRLAAQYGVNSQQALEAEEAFTKVADRLKEIDDRARDGRKSVGLYAQELSGLQEETKAASDSLKQIILEFGGNSKEAKNARKELRQLTKTLDNVEQQARDAAQGITRLESSLDKTNQKLTRLNNIARGLGLIALFNAFTEAVKGTDEGADGLQRGIGRLTLSLTAIVQALFKVGTAFKNGKGVLDAFSEGFENFGEGLDKAFAGLDEQIRLTRILRKAQANASVELERLNTQAQIYQSLSDNSKISLIEQRKAASLLNFTLREQNEIQLNLAKTQLRVAQAQREAKKTTESLEALRAAEANLIKVQNERLQINLEAFKKYAEILSDEAELELDIALDIADNQKTINERRISNEEEFLKERGRLVEENSKIIEDSFAFQVEIFEETQNRINKSLARQLAAEEKALSSRIENNQKAVDSNNELIESLSSTESERLKNATQIERINKKNEELSKKRFVLESLREDSINKQRKLRTKVVIDTNELINESDTKVVNERIKRLRLSEALQKRLIEVVRDRKTALQDLNDTQKELNSTLRDTLSIENDLEAQGEALNQLTQKNIRFRQILEELERKRNENSKNEIKDRLSQIQSEREARQNALQEEIFKLDELNKTKNSREVLVNGEKISQEELSNRRQALIEQLNATKSATEEELKLRQKLLNQLIDEEAEAGRKIVEQRVKIQRAASQVLTGFSEKFFEGQINRLDEQLEAVRRRSDEIRELSQRNVQSAGDALAFQQRREAELERERERERKRQQKSKLLFAILDTVSAKAAAGDDQPLRNAIFEGALLSAFVEAFPSFDTGVDVTGKGNVDGKGGFFSVLHPNETVLSAKDRAAMGNPLSRKDIIANYNLGKSVINQTVQADHSYSAEIISSLQDVKQAIKAKPALTEFKVNELAGMVTTIIEQQGNKQRFMQKYTRKH